MGLVVPRLVYAALLAALLLALGAASAEAQEYTFTVSPNPPNQGQATTFRLNQSETGLTVQWDVDGVEGFEQTGRTITHTYTAPGAVTVRMRVTESDGDKKTTSRTLTVNGAPAADFGFTPADPRTGEDVAFTPAVNDPEGDSVTLGWDFGDGTSSSAGAPSHSFAAAGTYPVVLTATDEHGAVTKVTRSVTVADDPGPNARFDYLPASPFTGDTITFTSMSTPSEGTIVATEWDLDGDGTFDDASGSPVSTSFDAAGDHLVQMRVTQENGKQSVAFAHVDVAERPPPQEPPPPPPGSGPAPPGTGSPAPDAPAPSGSGTTMAPTNPAPPRRMRPFPVVRIAGVVLPNGALVRILAVRAPRGATVVVRCRGKGCPARSVARTSAVRPVRFHRFERRLPAGVSLELFVRKAGRIGKYTRFLIRAGKAPARVDRCLMPGSARPVRCP